MKEYIYIFFFLKDSWRDQPALRADLRLSQKAGQNEEAQALKHIKIPLQNELLKILQMAQL